MGRKIILGESVDRLVWRSVFDSVWISVYRLDRDLIDVSFRDSLRDSLFNSVNDSIRDSVYVPIREKINNKKDENKDNIG